MDLSSEKNEDQLNLKQLRKKWGLTQKQVAKRVGIACNYYAEIERGKKAPSKLLKEKIESILSSGQKSDDAPGSLHSAAEMAEEKIYDGVSIPLQKYLNDRNIEFSCEVDPYNQTGQLVFFTEGEEFQSWHITLCADISRKSEIRCGSLVKKHFNSFLSSLCFLPVNAKRHVKYSFCVDSLSQYNELISRRIPTPIANISIILVTEAQGFLGEELICKTCT